MRCVSLRAMRSLANAKKPGTVSGVLIAPAFLRGPGGLEARRDVSLGSLCEAAFTGC